MDAEGVPVSVLELTAEYTNRAMTASPVRSFEGRLQGIQGTRLAVRTEGTACPLPLGTLVEVTAGDQLYLGEIKHYAAGRTFIDFDHQIRKPAVEPPRESAEIS